VPGPLVILMLSEGVRTELDVMLDSLATLRVGDALVRVAPFTTAPAGRNMTLLQTPLDTLHRELGAKMVPFAGYEMPVQYPKGIIKEHLHTREAVGVFDVSHMGQVVIEGPGCAAMLESLVPADVQGLAVHRSTYALFTNEQGGVLDDLIITRWAQDTFFLVVNAGCKEQDFAHLAAHLSGQTMQILERQGLLALQGPQAREVMAELCPAAADMVFMQGMHAVIDSIEVYITCSGYTGEDGFEISIPEDAAQGIAQRLLCDERVQPIGLGARDSLRLEAGLCLYGHELSTTINLIAAGLAWSIGKSRRVDGERAGGFPGDAEIFRCMTDKPASCRVGLKAQGKRPLRDGQPVLDVEGRQVGEISSACYGASAGGPIAMAYIERELAELGTELLVSVRDKQLPVSVVKLPFVAQRYFRG
jgi:aminomethyltransferase